MLAEVQLACCRISPSLRLLNWAMDLHLCVRLPALAVELLMCWLGTPLPNTSLLPPIHPHICHNPPRSYMMQGMTSPCCHHICLHSVCCYRESPLLGAGSVNVASTALNHQHLHDRHGWLCNGVLPISSIRQEECVLPCILPHLVHVMVTITGPVILDCWQSRRWQLKGRLPLYMQLLQYSQM